MMSGIAATLPLHLAGFAAAQDWGSDDHLLSATTSVSPFDAIAKLTRSSFASQVNRNFRIYWSAAKPADVQLIELRDTGGKQLPGVGECFSLTFSYPGLISIKQNTYIVENPVLGKFAILLVPTLKTAKGSLFIAVVNRRLR
jgi:hypothetical protein